ncbi:hypothetical protein ACQ4PT_047776 [Festuca glaucescens]
MVATRSRDSGELALRADPLDRKMLANRSRCWLRLGDAEKAVKDAIKCKNSHEGWAEAHHRHGEALMMLKEYEKACEVLTRGLELDPENNEMDKLFWMQLLAGEAVQALKADSSDLKMLANQSRCWRCLGDGEKALKDAVKCKNSNENWAEARHRHGEALMMLKALRADPSDRKMVANRSLCCLCLGDAEKAVKDAVKCKNSNEEWAEAHHRHGESLMMLKDYEKACEVLTCGLEPDPKNDEMDNLFR